MKSASWAGWIAGAAGSLVLTWNASRDPVPSPAPPTPPALARPATAEERARVAADAQRMEQDIAAARRVLGRPVRGDELESALPDGRPILAQGIPDNPLVAGIGAVVETCDATPQPATADWAYCPDTGQVRPGGS